MNEWEMELIYYSHSLFQHSKHGLMNEKKKEKKNWISFRSFLASGKKSLQVSFVLVPFAL